MLWFLLLFNSVFENKDVLNFVGLQQLLLLIFSLMEVKVFCVYYYDLFFWDLKIWLMTRGVEKE